MAKLNTFSLSALNLKASPFIQGQGAVLQALNVERDLIGGWRKRSGYTSYLGTPDNSEVKSLFSWTQNDGVTSFNYRVSNGIIYHSVGGTGAWTVSGNGTITSGAHFGHTVLDNVLIGGDGAAPTKHTTNGTSFTDTTNAPLAEHWQTYQQRAYSARGTGVSGTNTDLFFSTTGTATDWTTDSSSIRIPDAGRINSLFKAGDRLYVNKDGGNMFRWDGFSLRDLSTNSAPTSAYSIGATEGFAIYLNRQGYYINSGGASELISVPIEKQIYNNSGSAITGTTFNNAPGICYQNSYYCSVGTVTDDLMGITIPDAIHKYDFELNEWSNYQFANKPTAFGTYLDSNSNLQMIFGDSTGQVYQMSGSSLSDNGAPIEVQLMGFIHGNSLEDKKWNWIRFMFNPGCRAVVQYALSDTFTNESLQWQDIGDAQDGVVEKRFPANSRSKFMFWKIRESSTSSQFQLLGLEFDASEIKH